jgi:hypothetical protein
MSDGGPQYVSFVFKQFAQSYGLQHIVSSPRYAQSNGLAERGVQTIKIMLKKSDSPYIALHSYSATPLANGYSPAELLMSRKLLTLLPIAPKQLKPNLPNFRSLRENEKESKLKQKRNYDRRHRARLLTIVKTNDKVWITDQKKSGTVKTESNEPRSYIIQTDSGEIRRNRRHLAKIPESVKDTDKITSETAPDNSSKSDSHFISNLYSRNPLEKLNISMGKYVHGVNKRTTNLAIYGELGRYPLYIDTIISMIKYWFRLCKNTRHDPLLREAYEENMLMYGNNESCWLRCIHILLKHLNMDHMLTHPENFKSSHIYSIKKKLQNNYETLIWKINLNKCEKLRTYRKFKFIFRYETYISDIRNISHRNILTCFRTSNHKLHIETGRYTRPITPVENHICSNCNSKSVENDLHFIMYCPKFENHKRELFSNVLNDNAAILRAEDKFVWILSNEDPSCVRELAKFIH